MDTSATTLDLFDIPAALITAAETTEDDPPAKQSSSDSVGNWPDNLRQSPNALIRSALFRVGNNKTPRVIAKPNAPMKVAAYGSLEIFFIGEEMRQDDLDVLLELTHVSRGQPVDAPIFLCPAHIIRDLGWSRSADSYDRLRTIIGRLMMGVLKIRLPVDKEGKNTLTYKGSFIKSAAMFDNETNELSSNWRIEIDPNLFVFFNAKSYTRLNWEHRKRIRAPLGKFLHAFFSSHDGKVGIHYKKVMEIAGYGGSSAGTVRKFKHDMLKMLEKLKQDGAVADWSIDNDGYVKVAPLRWRLPKAA